MASDAAQIKRAEVVIHGFVLKETIGYGAYAKVKLGVNPLTKEVAAIKVRHQDS